MEEEEDLRGGPSRSISSPCLCLFATSLAIPVSPSQFTLPV